MRTNDFDYALPGELIAQEPAAERSASRLMVLDREKRAVTHDRFARIGDYLRAGDILVANRTRVIPARLTVHRRTGGVVEMLLLRTCNGSRWRALAKPSRKLRPGMQLDVHGSTLTATVEEEIGDGEWIVDFTGAENIPMELRGAGTVPLPPYIRNPTAPLERYQTVYADSEGSVAAPTAGLHFTQELLAGLPALGVSVEFVTLHVGIGTFRPVHVDVVEEHHMHGEWGEVPAAVAERINVTRAQGGRLVAVGTTTTRLLESATSEGGTVQAFEGETETFIYPGYRFRAVDALVTNFHLPRSTLFMLVCAFAGRDFVLEAYADAIGAGYRFYSFGDAMLLL